jgi:hypothetical protein
VGARQAGTNALIAKRAAALARLDARVTTARTKAEETPGELAPVPPERLEMTCASWVFFGPYDVTPT